MSYEKVVVQSLKPLNGGAGNGSKFYIISAGVGLGIGIIGCLAAGEFDIKAILVLAVLCLLIGWGIRNKILKYKSLYLRRMRFMVDDKPPYQELYERLLPTFNSLNMKMEMNENGTICVLYDGLAYDIYFNEDDTFSIYWHQSFLKAFIGQDYYIGIYKKVLKAMGMIAYYVQKECLNDNEVYYELAENENITNNNSVPEAEKKKVNSKVLMVIVCIFIAFMGMNVIAEVFGVIGEVFGSSTGMYASIIEECPCDIGSYSKEDIYEVLNAYADSYYETGTMNFVDLTDWRAGMAINDYMRYNDDYIGTGVILEGEIIAKYGNVIEIFDTPTFDEYGQMYDAGYVGTNSSIYFGADIGLTGISGDALLIGDQVQIVGMYCGKIDLGNGEYTPAIVAIDVYTMNYY